MNKKQYNNVIDWTLKHDQSAQTEDSLETARTIFKNMGVALPQGDLKQVSDVLKTDDYMGWRSCTMPEAQAAADKGTAAIGVSEEKIVILAANDEEQPVTATAAVMTLSDTAAVSAESDLAFCSYSSGDTTPGDTSGGPFTEYILAFSSWGAVEYTHLIRAKVKVLAKGSNFVRQILAFTSEEVADQLIAYIGAATKLVNWKQLLLNFFADNAIEALINQIFDNEDELLDIAYKIDDAVLDSCEQLKIRLLLGRYSPEMMVEDLNSGKVFFKKKIAWSNLDVLYTIANEMGNFCYSVPVSSTYSYFSD